LAEAALGSKDFLGEFAWLSWRGTVWRLTGASGAVYVKRAAELAGERDRIEWLTGRLPVPVLVGFVHANADDWLLTREMPGVPLHHPSLGGEPAKVAQRFGEILREIHSIDAAGCPFGEEGAGHVLIHGDYALPNVLVDKGRFSGLVDVGRSGLGDPRDDLAAALWSLHYNYGHGHAAGFLDAYGAPPMTDKEIERLRGRYAKPAKAPRRVGSAS
jgi:aminoglycoside phosphotransferase